MVHNIGTFFEIKSDLKLEEIWVIASNFIYLSNSFFITKI